MSKTSNHILITGSAGSGKTTLANYFKEHGKNAVDADLSGVGIWLNKKGDRVELPKDIDMRRINEWAGPRGLKWTWDENKLKELLSGSDELYFIGGSGNAFDLKELFDKCYFLDVDEKTVIQRLEKRIKDGTSYHDYGSTEEQRKKIISDLRLEAERARREGFEIVDAYVNPSQIFCMITNTPKKGKI
ncbi:dephospho-CoA kinase [Candidatus Bathyarchaeota archaeon]|nr:MAG: dephospho-CoA kinase [Candidatus Bathyarchaeota archaeon]